MGNQKGKDRTPGGGKQDYETDPEFFDIVNYEFRFGLDAAADDNNHKCSAYLTKNDDATVVNWIAAARHTKYGINIWLNPPYSRGLVNEFLKKCWEASQAGATVVALVHTCLDTVYWHEYVIGKPVRQELPL
jgi:site-specific DNA-methyltransferase (adenine-specific)